MLNKNQNNFLIFFFFFYFFFIFLIFGAFSKSKKYEKSKTNSFNTDSILEKIRTIDPDITNPKQALALLYELQAMLDS